MRLLGARENKVETYLDSEVEKHGGITRKWVSPGRAGVPDRIVFYQGAVFFVEAKTTDGKTSSAQRREMSRLEFHGARCFVVYGHSGVDAFIEIMVNA